MRICGPAPNIGGGFKGKECDRHVRFDERIGTGIAQEPDNRSIFLKRYEPGWTGISDAGCEPGDEHGVLDADEHPGERTCLVARQHNVFWVEFAALNLGDQRRHVVADDLPVYCNESSMIFREVVDSLKMNRTANHAR